MRTQLPVPMMYPVLYTVVLGAAIYAAFAGLSTVSLIPLVGSIAVLAAIDLIEWRRYPTGAPFPLALALLAIRLILYVVVATADQGGTARVLLLLLPFRLYFLFGPVVAVTAGAGLIGVIVLAFQLSSPGWGNRAERIDDLVMFAVGLTLSLAMAAVATEERAGRERLRQAAAAAERTRVGREIHDGVGHHLTAISILLAKATTYRPLDPAIADTAVRDAHEASRIALADVRRSVRTLDDHEPFDLIDALTSLGRGLPVDMTVSGDPAGYDDSRRLAIYRSAQEAITNALRHSAATRIDMNLQLGEMNAVVTVRDDGKGFDRSAVGRGLSGLRARIEGIGGNLRIESSRESGTLVTVDVPRVSR